MTAGLTAEQVRGKLRMLGQRRLVLGDQGVQLARETAAALAEARGLVSIAEAAALAGVARSTAYDALGKQRGDGDDERAAVGGTGSAT